MSIFNSLGSWLNGSQPAVNPVNITGTQHMVPNAMKFDSLEGLLGNLEMVGDQSFLTPSPLNQGGFLQNYGGLALGALQGAGNLFMGMKQYGMAKDALSESKRQFGLNYDAQRNLTNSRLEDRQRARLAANPNAHKSVDEYMNQYGIK